MVEKVLHAGNIAVAFSSVAMAADLTVTGGAGAAISASLSATDLFKRSSDKDARPLATKMADHMQDVLDRSHLSADRKKIVVQMLKRFAPSEDELSDGNRDARTIAAYMAQKIRELFKDPDCEEDPAFATATALDDYTRILADTLAPFVEPQDRKDADNRVALRRLDALLQQQSNGQTEQDRRQAEARQLMMRHQFEETMDEMNSSYTEVTQLLILLIDENVSVQEARHIIVRQAK
ncbi:hypothetical protein [uncultured Roseovarius sp.]|uniref:hypothetical protein n=1 Tax=uncultured Roseovarius sp. TaxID=293344 RepID=UPI00262C3597|nr:hypothetical protein [uncultured Roseovarius sp.]